jgi:hypothetical protein
LPCIPESRLVIGLTDWALISEAVHRIEADSNNTNMKSFIPSPRGQYIRELRPSQKRFEDFPIPVDEIAIHDKLCLFAPTPNYPKLE